MTEGALPDKKEVLPETEQIDTDVQIAYGRILMAFEGLKLTEPHGFVRTPKGDYDRFRFTRRYADANKLYRQEWENHIHGAAENFPWPLNNRSAKVVLGATRLDGLQMQWIEGDTRYFITVNPEGTYFHGPDDQKPSLTFSKTIMDGEGYTTSSDALQYHDGKIVSSHLEVKTWDPSNIHQLDVNEPSRPDRPNNREIIETVNENGSYVDFQRTSETTDADIDSLQSAEAWVVLNAVIDSLEQAATTV